MAPSDKKNHIKIFGETRRTVSSLQGPWLLFRMEPGVGVGSTEQTIATVVIAGVKFGS